MRKKLFILLFLVLSVKANKDYELFLKGNHLLKIGSLQEALDSYNQIKIKSSAIAYNKALVLFGLQRYSEALGQCCQAQLKAEGSLAKKIKHTKTVIQNKLGLSKDSFLYVFFLDMQSGMWLGLWQLLFFLSLCSMIWFIYIYNFEAESFLLQYLKVKKPIRKRSVLFFLFLLFCSMIKIFSYYYVRQSYVVILPKEASVYVGPCEEFDKIGTLSVGVCAELVDENDAWCKIHNSDIKSRGWIQKQNVFIVEDYN